MRLRHAILGMAAIMALGACAPPSGETKAPPAQAVPAAAEPAAASGIAAFRGSWVGASQGEGETRRAAGLVIDASADGGLYLQWRSAEGPRDGAADDPLKMREETALFPPGKTPNVWSTRLDSGARAKAQLEGATLTVELTAKTNGKTEVQTYRRTLTAPDRMSLRYTRAVAGKVESTIDAEFVKLP
ncbi:hypothetical protein KXR53_02430 [Inquilinus limosus]|uniref:hypothetical protein n=1 Tax=Inquilinus limosus TaxID=171674 RepID=UPI003F17A43F